MPVPETPRVLVTGAAGFIGSHVADHCLALGMEVVATDDLSGGFLENVPEKATWVEGDLTSTEFAARLWREQGPFDYVYHLGAYAAEGLSHFIRAYNYRTNLIASMHVLNEAIKSKTCKCFVFSSSIAVYGRGRTPMTEEMIPQPEDPYGIAKYAVELDLRAAREMFGTRFIIFRPHNVYGARQNIADKYRNVIGIFMNQLLHDQPMSIFGDGLQTRAFSHIDDVAPIIARSPSVPEAYDRVFNIGADIPYTLLELAEETAAAFGKPAEIVHLAARNEVTHAFCDHTQLRSMFGTTPGVDLQTGLRRMAEWVRARGPMTPVRFSQLELRENIPASWEN